MAVDVQTLMIKWEARGYREVERAAASVDVAVTRSLGRVNSAFRNLDGTLNRLVPTVKNVTKEIRQLGTNLDYLATRGADIRITINNLDDSIRDIKELDRLLTAIGARNVVVKIRVPSLAAEIAAVGRLAERLEALGNHAGPFNVVIHISDTSQQSRELKDLLQHLTKLKVMPNIDIKVKVSSLMRESESIKKLTDALDRLRTFPNRYDINVHVGDFSKEARGISALSRALEKLKANDKKYKITITVPNLTDEARAINTLSRSLDRLNAAGKRIFIRVRVDSVEAEILQLERLAKAIRTIRGKDVKVSVNQTSVLTGIIGLGILKNRIGAVGTQAILTGIKMTLMTGAFAAATAAASAFGAVALGLAGGALVGVIGALGGAAIGLASAFAVAGAGVAAFALFAYPAIHGVTDAFKNYTKAVDEARAAQKLGDMKAYDAAVKDQGAALANLSPLQKTVITNLQNLKDVWQETSKQFEPVTLGLFNRAIGITKDLLPSLKAIAEPVGDALTGVFDKIAAGIKGSKFQGFIDTVRQSAGGLVTQFGDIGLNVAGAFGAGFTNGLPLIQQVMTSIVGGSDKFQKMFEGQGFKDFITFAQKMLPLVGGLFSSLLGTITSLFKGLEPLAEPALKALTSLSNTLAGIFKGDQMKGFVDTVVQLLPLVASTLGSVAGAFLGLLTAVKPLAVIIVPVIGQIADALTRLFKGDSAKLFVDSIGKILPLVAPVLEILAGAFLDLVSVIAQSLVPVIPLLLGPLADLAGVLVNVATAVFGSGLLESLATLIGAVVGLLPPLVPLIAALATGLVPVFAAITQALIDSGPEWQNLITAFVNLIPPLTQMLTAFLPLLPQVVLVAAAFAETLVPALTMVMGWITNLGEWLQQHPTLFAVLVTAAGVAAAAFWAITTVVPIVMTVLGALGVVLDVLAGAVLFLTSPIGLVVVAVGILAYEMYKHWDGIKKAVGGAIDWISDKLSSAIVWFMELPRKCIEAVQNFGSVLHDSGAKLIDGFVDGIKSKLSAPYDAVKGMLSSVRNLFPFSPAKEGPFSGKGYTTFSGAALAEGLGKGFQSKIPSLKADISAGLSLANAQFGLPSNTLLPSSAATPLAASTSGSSGGTMVIRGDFTFNGMTASEAPAGSPEAGLHSMAKTLEAAFNAALNSAQTGGTF